MTVAAPVRLASWMVALLAIFTATAQSDEVTLKNGTILTGSTIQVAGLNAAAARSNGKNFSYWVIDDGVRRFFVHRRLVEKHVEIANLGSNVSFQLKHEKSSRTSGFPVIGGFGSIQPFDEFGRRTVTLATQKGMIPIIQGIKVLRPGYADLESLTHAWDYSIDTMTLPADVVQSIIAKSSNRDDPAERKAAVLFYLQAQMFNEAREEVRQLGQRFPDMAPWCEEYQRMIGDYIARKAVNEIERRRNAGQHLLAFTYARQFPAEDVSAEVRQIAEDVHQQYEQSLMDRDRALLQLDVLQAQLPETQFIRLKSLRASLQKEMHYETLPRLEPFLRSLDDETLPVAQKLSLAYSGWLLGNANALLDLDETIRLWDARFLMLDYLRSDQDPLREEEIVKQLESIEGIGMERAALMLQHLPLPFEPPVTEIGAVQDVMIPSTGDRKSTQYSVLLPPEYSPAHRYPLLVVLRSERSTFQNEVRWWGGDSKQPGWAMRRGYIVIAPHYCEENATGDDPGLTDQAAILNSINHARQRFRIDSDRIFLGGHGMGADACFDFAMGHPGLFAGVMPIAGNCPKICRPCWDNAPRLAWYVVGGERDRNTLENNAPILTEMMRHGQNVIYCEYKNRGYETYFEEQDRLFTWMQPLRRTSAKETARFEASSTRSADNRFFWLQARLIQERPPSPNPRPAKYEGAITPGGGIYISHPGKATTLWLSPEIFDFKQKCEVRVNLKYVHNDYLKPSLGAMLNDLRERGDRERLYWIRLDL